MRARSWRKAETVRRRHAEFFLTLVEEAEPGVEGAQQRRWLQRLDASSGWRTPRLHMLAVAALTVVVSLILYTVAVLEYPFDGSLRVKPEAFESGSRKTRARR